jgi:hypothetical protein
MTRRITVIGVLAGALALLGGSLAWAVTRGDRLGHRYGYGPAMMGLGYAAAAAHPVGGIAEARNRAQAFADRLGLRTDEVLRFRRNYYVKLVDAAGEPATEALVDPATGATGIEFGPAMMWNTKYGMLSGRFDAGMASVAGMRSMMGSYGGDYSGMMGGRGYGGMMGRATTAPAAPPRGGSVSLIRAQELAQTWLDANEPGLTVEKGGDAFPGYYTLETLRAGRIAGMISVDAATGAVWPHWWHGEFVEAAP